MRVAVLTMGVNMFQEFIEFLALLKKFYLMKGRWYGRKADQSHLEVFGYVTYVHIPDSQSSKLDKKCVEVDWVYCISSKILTRQNLLQTVPYTLFTSIIRF